MNKSIEEEIIKVLKKEKSLTTYAISKKLNLTFATVNPVLWRMKTEKKVKMEIYKPIYGHGKKQIWALK